MTLSAGAATIDTLITNINADGEWVVVQMLTSRHGPFRSFAEAQAFAVALTGEDK